MGKVIDKQSMLDLIIEAKRTEPESGSFAEWLAEYMVEHLSTLPQPSNEPLTLISMRDELPPDNERVLVYRPCMANADIGPYSVQWGWAAKRDGSHWAHLPDHRPPEGADKEQRDELCAGN